MPTSVPVATKSPGEILTSSLWNTAVRDNINKLLNTGHRVLTVAQFSALTGIEGTKGTVAPDEVYLEVDSTNGHIWHLAYESGEPTYKWRFLGGSAMMSEITTVESTSSITYAALTTAGPSVAIPRAGDYGIEMGYRNGQSVAATMTFMSYDIGGTAAVDADASESWATNATPWNPTSAARRRRKPGLTSVTLTAKYRNTVATSTPYANRWMFVFPVRIRHDA